MSADIGNHGPAAPGSHAGNRRWFALILLCVGQLMIVLDTTIVNVALPSIQSDLGFAPTSLSWVVNAYLLTFGGFLLLGGRAGDLFGSRPVFIFGLSLFTLASIACGAAWDDVTLVASRAVQGLGGAVVAATSLSSVLALFPEPGERARAMGVFAFVASGGGTIGVLAGGVLTDVLDWRWIFLVNVPIGVVAIALSPMLLPRGIRDRRQGIDILGALLITASVMFAVFGVVRAGTDGWNSATTVVALTGALLGLAAFAAVEHRAQAPLVPFAALRRRSLAGANVVAPLLAGGMFTLFFFAPLLMERSLAFSPLQVGVGFLPASLLMMALSLGLSARLVMRFGTKLPLVAGVGALILALLLFATAPSDADYAQALLPSLLLIGLGGGLAFSPLMLTATADAAPEHAGLAAGLINTTQMLGGALGLAVTAAVAASRTSALSAEQPPDARAFVEGLQSGALVAAGLVALAGLVAVAVLRQTPAPTPPSDGKTRRRGSARRAAGH